MVDIGTITLYREKSIVHKFAGLSDENDARETPVLQLRSNRVTIPAKTALNTVMVVVRGQNIPGTMHMTALVVDELRRHAGVIQDPGSVDWEGLWRRRVSRYESDHNSENWVSVHFGGEAVYVSGEGHEAICEVEALAIGVEVTDSIVMEASNNVLGALEDLVVQHDSQAAFVFTPGETYHRAAILERRDRKTGSYSMSVHHPSPARPVRLSHFISYCADITETLTHKSFLDRVQELAAQNALSNTNITPSLIQATRNRRKELITQIENFESVNKVVYRPERPSL